jgi:NAD(P)-dependent dehydrogenase (short-subunit alcohol dehydrogenase family)
VVTGGASGIGAAAVARFARAGAAVVAIDLVPRTAPAEAAAAIPGDVADEDSISNAMAAAVQKLGGIDVLVCSAGVALRGTVEETSPAEWDRVFAVNVRGVYLAARAALPSLRGGEAPAIVNVASQLGLVANARNAAYCASKGAVVQLTRAMALDCVRSGVRVNAVCPGATRTPMTSAHYGVSDTEFEARGEQVLGRLVEPDEIAAAIEYLASPAAAAVVGELLVVDGGYTIH